jgi:exonuclease III
VGIIFGFHPKRKLRVQVESTRKINLNYYLCLGNSGVIRDNLTSLWIPAGWTWGGLVSDHCPIWIEFDLS